MYMREGEKEGRRDGEKERRREGEEERREVRARGTLMRKELGNQLICLIDKECKRINSSCN